MDTGRDLAIMVECYMRLLRMPYASSSRTRLQSVLAGLRDEIAFVSPGWSAEAVQETCEGIALLLEQRHD